MRLCRFGDENLTQIGYYNERGIVSLSVAFTHYEGKHGKRLPPPLASHLLAYLPPDGAEHHAARTVGAWLEENLERLPPQVRLDPVTTPLLVPIPQPHKIFLLAGNYADHIREGGGVAAERAQTFPYVFMKPPSTTLTHPGKPVRIPRVAPDAVDWELELAVVIGRKAKHVPAPEALQYVAGYTIINDISQRRFRPNPKRQPREKDAFFDWLHGKWFDTFCPCGPCIASADAISDPQDLSLTLELNGEVRQSASTAQQIFPVAEVISFLSNIVTLEPGDLISTGTPAGVGHSTGRYLQPGDLLCGSIARIGTLITPVAAE